MNYLWGAVSAISAPYQYYRDLPPLNPSTLTGAIDVIVIRRPASTSPSSPSSPSSSSSEFELACTPFHVRFGKWQVLRPAEKKVKVLVNGAPIPYSMKIGEAGEAFFVFETDGDVPDALITSPILAPASPPSSSAALPGTGRFGARDDMPDEPSDPAFFDLDAPGTTAAAEADALDEGGLLSHPVDAANAAAHAVAESERGARMHVRDRVRARYSAVTSSAPAPEETHDEGDDVLPPRPDVKPSTILDNGDIMIDMGGYHSQQPSNQSHGSEYHDAPSTPTRETSGASARDAPFPDAPARTPRLTGSGPPVSFPSLRATSEPPADSDAAPAPPDEYSWEWGAFPQRSPAVATFPHAHARPGASRQASGDGGDEPQPRGSLEFHRSKSLPPELEDEGALSEPELETGRSDGEEAPGAGPLSDNEGAGPPARAAREGKGGGGWGRWWRRGGGAKARTQSVDVRAKDGAGAAAAAGAGHVRAESSGAGRPGLREIESSPVIPTAGLAAPKVDEPEQEAEAPSIQVSTEDAEPPKRYAKTLRLTSEQLESLDLKPGANTLTFSLSATGNVACTANIYLWEHTDHIVVSDIDGTITKSDALGHVYAMIGRDWTHPGVAKLYTDVARNGYKMMYLTSRAIGQADTTRWYLQSIKQGDHQLPEGPVIMSPDRLLASLHREVIMRKPEVFKMACLRDIQRLFAPAAARPFYAGFGNRITDAMSYRAVNIPSSRIFTIDTNGEVRMELLELAGYKSPSVQSYIHMTDLVDQMFPPVRNAYSPEFVDSSYWSAPVADVELPDLTPPSPALSARSDTTLARLRNFSLRGGRSSAATAAAAAAVAAEDGPRGRPDARARTTSASASSLSRISGALASLSRSVSPGTSASALSPARSTTDISEEDEDAEAFAQDFAEKGQRRRRRRMSIPGSLLGSEDEDEEDAGGEGEGVEGEEEEGVLFGGEGEGGEEDGEPEEPTFDDDLFATGEMSKVPFL